MHRSGTSLVAGILNLMGVYLGPAEHMMKPNPDNPKGFWEHQGLTDLNDKILTRLGGSWHEPPAFPPRWELSPDLEDLREEAYGIIRDDMAKRELWGWKDPRTCLTLPFWQQLVPDMQYVICLRNPVDVARSLERRDKFTLRKASELWTTYVTLSIRHSSGKPRMYIFYEDLMRDPQRALERFCAFLDVPNTEILQHKVHEFKETELQHHCSSVFDNLKEPDIDFITKAFYTMLRLSVDKDKNTDQVDRTLDEIVYALAESARQASQLMKEQDSTMMTLRCELQDKAKALSQLQSDVNDRNNTIITLQSELDKKMKALAQLETDLMTLKKSFGYRFMRAYASLFDGIAPEGTRRGRLRKSVVRKISERA
jgi:hypothetical protein